MCLKPTVKKKKSLLINSNFASYWHALKFLSVVKSRIQLYLNGILWKEIPRLQQAVGVGVGVGRHGLCLWQNPWIRCKSPHNEFISWLFCAGLSSYFRTDIFHFHRELVECLESCLEKGICPLLWGRRHLLFLSPALHYRHSQNGMCPVQRLQNCCKKAGQVDTRHL